MCGRIYVKTSVEGLLENFAFARPHADDGLDGLYPRFNGAPGLEYPIIVPEPDYPGGMFMAARWGLIPGWVKEANPKLKPINATAERVASAPMFRAAYRARRALLPIDGFFEWRAIMGAKGKQPYAIAMKDGKPFALAAIWESWRNPEMGDTVKTFAVITCPANEMMCEIHDRMPVIIAPENYVRWLSTIEPDPRDLLVPYPAELMTMWPISTRVNSPRNDDRDLLTPVT